MAQYLFTSTTAIRDFLSSVKCSVYLKAVSIFKIAVVSDRNVSRSILNDRVAATCFSKFRSLLIDCALRSWSVYYREYSSICFGKPRTLFRLTD